MDIHWGMDLGSEHEKYLCEVTLHPPTLHSTPYTLNPTPCTLHPAPYTLHPTHYTLHTTHYTLQLPVQSARHHGAERRDCACQPRMRVPPTSERRQHDLKGFKDLNLNPQPQPLNSKPRTGRYPNQSDMCLGEQYGGTSLISNSPPPKHDRRALGVFLL